MSLSITPIKHDICTEILLQGTALVEIDFDLLNQAVEESIREGQSNVILNLKQVDLLNSIGINTLIRIFTKCRNNGGDMFIVNISDKINQVLLLTKLNTVLNIATSVEEAEQKLTLN
jgi:anti-sigma B factor antagonist